jgi:hypothetical protein
MILSPVLFDTDVMKAIQKNYRTTKESAPEDEMVMVSISIQDFHNFFAYVCLL